MGRGGEGRGVREGGGREEGREEELFQPLSQVQKKHIRT